jgi:exopolysaccharide biosynthesis polyprenyl glycosylphosphotransferase
MGGAGVVQRVPKNTAELELEGSAALGAPAGIYWRKAAQPLLLFSIDSMFLAASLALSWLLSNYWANLSQIEAWTPQRQIGIYGAFGGFFLAFLALAGSYNSAHRGSLARDSVRVIGAGALVAVLLGLAVLPLAGSAYGLVLGGLVWLNCTFLLLLAKVVGRKLVEVLGERGVWCRRLIIVGDSDSASYATRELEESGVLYRVLGLVDLDGNDRQPGRSNGIPHLGTVDTLAQVVESHQPCEVLICATAQQFSRVGDDIHNLVPPKTLVNLALSPLMGSVVPAGHVSPNGAFHMVRVQTGRWSWQYEGLKRVLDTLVAALVLIAAAPVMAIIAVAIKLDSPGPVFFRQIRIGRGGHPFTMYKFRSMAPDSEAKLRDLLQENEASGPMFKISSDPRVTRVGRIIRRLSLDELPQLFNVLEGNMSLVGPRPPLPHEVEQYEPWHCRRLQATPGMTGLWQVTRGEGISFDEMVRRDLEYIQHWSLLLDVKILFRTIPAVLSARGAY